MKNSEVEMSNKVINCFLIASLDISSNLEIKSRPHSSNSTCPRVNFPHRYVAGTCQLPLQIIIQVVYKNCC